QANTLYFTPERLLSSNGSDDGRWTAAVHVGTLTAFVAALDTSVSFVLDNTPPDTLAISFAPDTSEIYIDLVDRPAVAGRAVAGIDTKLSTASLTGPGTHPYTLRNDGVGRLTLRFDQGKPQTSGIFTLSVTAVDRAANNVTRTRSFVVGGSDLRPGAAIAEGPFNRSLNTAAVTQPLTVSLALTDNSGAGIDWSATTAHLLGPDSTAVAGTLNHQNNILAFQAGRSLSSAGADDGRWRLAVHVADLMSATADLDTVFTFLLDNLPPDTADILFAPDTSAIHIDLVDRPAVVDRECSGLNIAGATATVTGPDGAVAATLNQDGVGRLSLHFDEGKPTAAGSYTLTVTAADRAGNQAVLTRAFSLNVSGYVEVSPPDSSLVHGPWVRVWALVRGAKATFTPGGGASLRVNYRGVPLAGTQSVAGDTLRFQFADTLAEDGSADGRYDMLADLAVAELAGRTVSRTIFTVDNRAPDTAGVQITVAADGVRSTAAFTDWGLYPDVSGIDRGETKVVIEDPDGHEIRPRSQSWLSSGELEADFDALSRAGLHRLRLTVTDLAGWSTVRRKTLVNTFGLSAGQPVAYVEEVPARTSAHITFVSGQAGARISRAVLRIFNLRGDLVRRVDVSDRIDGSGSSVNAEWLLQNDRGDLVMNGVFIYAWEISYDNGRHEEMRKTLAVARR
ncbi:Ig-like domain-containing protein, partial [bacterium]|nr:Ig-like domain-containing protein [bacterium]